MRKPDRLGSLDAALRRVMPEDLWAPFTRTSALRFYRRKEIIFHQDEPAECLILLAKGSILLSRAAFGRSIILSWESAPAAITTIGVLDGGTNTVTATAARECEALAVARRDVLRACLGRRSAMNWLLRVSCGQVRELTCSVDLHALGTVRQRLARALIKMAESGPTTEISVECNQDKLALIVGTVREVVFRNLKSLETDGVLHRHGRNITIDDLTALKHNAGLT